MFENEIKSIETLLAAMTLNDPVKETTSHHNAKLNLFNMININYLINNFYDNPTFSLLEFLDNGLIKDKYETSIPGPSMDLRWKNNPIGFYKALIKAFIEGNYVFDDEHHIFVASYELETSISPEWLYRLVQGFKDEKVNRIFFYNKKEENSILNENALVNYLNHTKMFYIEAIPENKKSFEQKFNSIREKIIKEQQNKGIVKVDDIISSFEEKTTDINSKISKFRMASNLMIVSRANSMGVKFYSKPLEEQQKLIESWLIEFLNSNEISAFALQNYLISPTETQKLDKKTKEQIIIGLFNLYINTICSIGIDFDNISLSMFKIKEYVSKNMEQDLLEINRLIKEINKDNHLEKREKLIKRQEKLQVELQNLDIETDAEMMQKKRKDLQKIIEEFGELERAKESQSLDRKSLESRIRYQKEHALEEIAFDNSLVMSLIRTATNRGRVYINPLDTSKMIIEIVNNETGIITFQTEIALKNILSFNDNIDIFTKR